jgi:hypothetical protein
VGVSLFYLAGLLKQLSAGILSLFEQALTGTVKHYSGGPS